MVRASIAHVREHLTLLDHIAIWDSLGRSGTIIATAPQRSEEINKEAIRQAGSWIADHYSPHLLLRSDQRCGENPPTDVAEDAPIYYSDSLAEVVGLTADTLHQERGIPSLQGIRDVPIHLHFAFDHDTKRRLEQNREHRERAAGRWLAGVMGYSTIFGEQNNGYRLLAASPTPIEDPLPTHYALNTRATREVTRLLKGWQGYLSFEIEMPEVAGTILYRESGMPLARRLELAPLQALKQCCFKEAAREVYQQ